MLRVLLESAYPGIAFRPRTHNWFARLTRRPAECVHLENDQTWMATLIPDILYLRGKAVRRGGRGGPARPEVSLCRACLVEVLAPELAAFGGRVVAFEPDAESFTQYFFVATPDFDAAGLQPEVAAAIERRLAETKGTCEQCSRPAHWLWVSRNEVSSLDEVSRIVAAPGLRLCAAHGAQTLCRSFEVIEVANLFYVNAPYGDAGAYVWI